MNIILIGFMCSGKSRVGQSLSKKLGWPHFDTDEIIVKDVGVSIADIIRKRGESAFRTVEKKAVQLVALSDKCVISTGGGVPTDPENTAALKKNGWLVWLQISAGTVLKRAGNLNSRPLIDPKDPLGSIKARMADRRAAYAVADFSLDVENQTPDEIADKIIAVLPPEAT